jgi:hypothetical protein
VLAYQQGYEQRLRDQLAVGAETGYWSAYFSNNKHQKPLKTIIQKIYSSGREQRLSDEQFDSAVARHEELERRRLADGNGAGA